MLGEFSGIGLYEVGTAAATDFIVVTENVVRCDLIDNLGRCDSKDLLFEDMIEPLAAVGEKPVHPLAVVEAFDDFSNVEAALQQGG